MYWNFIYVINFALCIYGRVQADFNLRRSTKNILQISNFYYYVCLPSSWHNGMDGQTNRNKPPKNPRLIKNICTLCESSMSHKWHDDICTANSVIYKNFSRHKPLKVLFKHLVNVCMSYNIFSQNKCLRLTRIGLGCKIFRTS